jgi:hypothetical protein
LPTACPGCHIANQPLQAAPVPRSKEAPACTETRLVEARDGATVGQKEELARRRGASSAVAGVAAACEAELDALPAEDPDAAVARRDLRVRGRGAGGGR